MCGLFGGMSSWLSPFEIEVVKQLGILSWFRGQDSTGLVSVHESSNDTIKYGLKKEVVDPATFLGFKSIEPLFERPKVLAGHARAATIGDISVKNAHPFNLPSLIGMHNGSIHNFAAKDKTDSETLFECFEEFGIKETLQEVEHLHGAYALVWIDKTDKTINFIRNNERPLWYIRGLGGCLFWSSEEEMLNFVVNRRNSGSFGVPQKFMPGVQYKAKIGTIVFSHDKIVEEKKTITSHFLPTTATPPITSSERPNVTTPQVLKYPYVQQSDTTIPDFLLRPGSTEASQDCRVTHDPFSKETRKALKATRKIQKQEKRKKHQELKKTYVGYDGLSFTEDFINERLKEGCSMCGTESGIDDIVYWHTHTEHYCEHCGNSEYVDVLSLHPGYLKSKRQ